MGVSPREGKYVAADSPSFKMRISHQQQIKIFVKKVFGSRNALTLEEYNVINLNESSEMLYAVLGLFHQVLPYSDTVFRLKEIFQS